MGIQSPTNDRTALSAKRRGVLELLAVDRRGLAEALLRQPVRPPELFSRNEGQTARLYRQHDQPEGVSPWPELLPQAATDDRRDANDSRAGSHVEDACAGRLRARRV